MKREEWIEIFQLVTFVPAEWAEKFAADITPHIPALPGCYDQVCWHSAPGTEQYRPLEGARPEAGQPGELKRAASVRFEFTIPADEATLARFAETLKSCHPWEEPVITAIPARSLKY